MERDPGLLTIVLLTAGGTSRFPQTPSTARFAGIAAQWRETPVF
jgi:hypothetical protein